MGSLEVGDYWRNLKGKKPLLTRVSDDDDSSDSSALLSQLQAGEQNVRDQKAREAGAFGFWQNFLTSAEIGSVKLADLVVEGADLLGRAAGKVGLVPDVSIGDFIRKNPYFNLARPISSVMNLAQMPFTGRNYQAESEHDKSQADTMKWLEARRDPEAASSMAGELVPQLVAGIGAAKLLRPVIGAVEAGLSSAVGEGVVGTAARGVGKALGKSYAVPLFGEATGSGMLTVGTVNSLLGAANDLQQVKSGHMSVAEFNTRRALDFGAGGVTAGTPMGGKITNLLTDVTAGLAQAVATNYASAGVRGIEQGKGLMGADWNRAWEESKAMAVPTAALTAGLGAAMHVPSVVANRLSARRAQAGGQAPLEQASAQGMAEATPQAGGVLDRVMQGAGNANIESANALASIAPSIANPLKKLASTTGDYTGVLKDYYEWAVGESAQGKSPMELAEGIKARHQDPSRQGLPPTLQDGSKALEFDRLQNDPSLKADYGVVARSAFERDSYAQILRGSLEAVRQSDPQLYSTVVATASKNIGLKVPIQSTDQFVALAMKKAQGAGKGLQWLDTAVGLNLLRKDSQAPIQPLAEAPPAPAQAEPIVSAEPATPAPTILPQESIQPFTAEQAIPPQSAPIEQPIPSFTKEQENVNTQRTNDSNVGESNVGRLEQEPAQNQEPIQQEPIQEGQALPGGQALTADTPPITGEPITGEPVVSKTEIPEQVGGSAEPLPKIDPQDIDYRQNRRAIRNEFRQLDENDPRLDRLAELRTQEQRLGELPEQIQGEVNSLRKELQTEQAGQVDSFGRVREQSVSVGEVNVDEQGRTAVERLRERGSIMESPVPAKVKLVGEPSRKARYALVPISEVITSHDPFTFSENPAFPTKNSRNYAEEANRNAVMDRSSEGKFDPELILDASNTVTHGPTMVTDDMIAVGGNERAMLVARVAKQQGEAWNSYMRSLENDSEQFLSATPEQVRQFMEQNGPSMLVRIVDEKGVPYTTELMARYNGQFDKSASASERFDDVSARMAMPENIPIFERIADVLQEYDTIADLNNSNNPAIKMSLVRLLEESGIIAGTHKISDFYDANTNKFTPNGLQALEQSALAPIVKPELMPQVEGTQIGKALRQSVGPLLENSRMGEYSISPELTEGIELYRKKKANNLKFDELVRGLSFVDDPPTTPGIMIAMLFDTPKNFREFVEIVNSYSPKADASDSLFELPPPPVREEIFMRALTDANARAKVTGKVEGALADIKVTGDPKKRTIGEIVALADITGVSKRSGGFAPGIDLASFVGWVPTVLASDEDGDGRAEFLGIDRSVWTGLAMAMSGMALMGVKGKSGAKKPADTTASLFGDEPLPMKQYPERVQSAIERNARRMMFEDMNQADSQPVRGETNPIAKTQDFESYLRETEYDDIPTNYLEEAARRYERYLKSNPNLEQSLGRIDELNATRREFMDFEGIERDSRVGELAEIQLLKELAGLRYNQADQDVIERFARQKMFMELDAKNNLSEGMDGFERKKAFEMYLEMTKGTEVPADVLASVRKDYYQVANTYNSTVRYFDEMRKNGVLDYLAGEFMRTPDGEVNPLGVNVVRNGEQVTVPAYDVLLHVAQLKRAPFASTTQSPTAKVGGMQMQKYIIDAAEKVLDRMSYYESAKTALSNLNAYETGLLHVNNRKAKDKAMGNLNESGEPIVRLMAGEVVEYNAQGLRDGMPFTETIMPLLRDADISSIPELKALLAYAEQEGKPLSLYQGELQIAMNDGVIGVKFGENLRKAFEYRSNELLGSYQGGMEELAKKLDNVTPDAIGIEELITGDSANPNGMRTGMYRSKLEDRIADYTLNDESLNAQGRKKEPPKISDLIGVIRKRTNAGSADIAEAILNTLNGVRTAKDDAIAEQFVQSARYKETTVWTDLLLRADSEPMARMFLEEELKHRGDTGTAEGLMGKRQQGQTTTEQNNDALPRLTESEGKDYYDRALYAIPPQLLYGGGTSIAAHLLTADLEDDKEYFFGLNGRQIKAMAMMGSMFMYNRNIQRKMLTIGKNALGAGSRMRGLLEFSRAYTPEPPATPSKEIAWKALAKSEGFEENTQPYNDYIQGLREMDRENNVGLKYPGLTGLVQAARLTPMGKKLEAEITKVRRESGEHGAPIYNAFKGWQKKYDADAQFGAFEAAAEVDFGIGEIKRKIKDPEMRLKVIENFKDEYRNALQGNVRTAYDELQGSILQMARRNHAEGIVTRTTGLLPSEFEEAKIRSKEVIERYEPILDEMKAKLESGTVDGDDLINMQVVYNKLFSERKAAISTYDKIIRGEALYLQASRELYMPRWFDKTGDYTARVRYFEEDPGERYVFESEQERDEFLAIHPFAEKEDSAATVTVNSPDAVRELASGKRQLTQRKLNDMITSLYSIGVPETQKMPTRQAEQIIGEMAELQGIIASRDYIKALRKKNATVGVTPAELRGLIDTSVLPAPPNHLMNRKNVAGYLPDKASPDYQKDMVTWGYNAVNYMVDYGARGIESTGVVRSINKQMEELARYNVAHKYQQWLATMLTNVHVKPDKLSPALKNIEDFATAGIYVSTLAMNVGSAMKNVLYGATTMAPEAVYQYMTRRKEMGLPLVSGKELLSLPQLATQILRKNSDVREVYNRIGEFNGFDAQYKTGALEGLPSRFRTSKVLELSFLPQKLTEELNRKLAVVAGATLHLQRNPGDIEGAINSALIFADRTQGRYASYARTNLENKVRNVPVVGRSATALLSAAARSTEMIGSLWSDALRRRNPASMSALAAYYGMTMVFGGLANSLVAGDVFKLTSTMYDWFEKEEKPGAVRENASEYFKRRVQNLGEAMGMSGEAMGKLYDTFHAGYLTQLTGKNFSNDATLSGMTDLALISKFESGKRVGKNIFTKGLTPETITGLATFSNTMLGRATRAYYQLQADAVLGKKMNDLDVLREGYGFGDAIYELALGKSYEDTRAGMMKFDSGGGVYSAPDALGFAKKLKDITGMKDSPLFRRIATNQALAEEFRYRLLNQFDKQEPELGSALSRVSTMVERNPTFFRELAGVSGQDYGTGGRTDGVMQNIRRAVKEYYVAEATLATAQELGLPVPRYTMSGQDPLLPAVEYIMRTLKERQRERKKYGIMEMQQEDDGE